MMKNVISKFLGRKNVKKECPLTIINTNRTKVDVRQRVIYQKKERQKTCLSKYFEDIKGLNSVEKNIYCEILP